MSLKCQNEIYDQNSVIFERKQQKINTIKSQLIQEYLKMIEIGNIKDFNQLRQVNFEKLKLKNILSDQDKSSNGFSFRIVSHSPNFECLVLKVCYYRFSFFFTIIFVYEDSLSHQLHDSSSGHYSKVYKAQIFDKVIAIKCTHFKTNFDKIFKMVLTQYIIFKVSSVLQIGPNMEKMMGFDILIYDNCIEYCMEYCQQNISNRKQNIFNDLSHGLKTLHSIKIIHSDIKPDNICYSNENKKIVFVDYGLHKVIQEDIGFKTYTFFQGTADFCSKQMKECYSAFDTRYIDLYFNDSHCLLESIKNIINDNYGFMKKKQRIPTNITSQFILLIFKGVLIDNYYVYKFNCQSFRKHQQRFIYFSNKKDKYQVQYFIKILQQQHVIRYQNSRLRIKLNNIYEQKSSSSSSIQFLQKDCYQLDKQKQFQKRKQLVETLSESTDRQSIIIFKDLLKYDNPQQLQNLQYCKKLEKDLYIFKLSKTLQIISCKINQQKIQKIMDVCNVLFKCQQQFKLLTFNGKLTYCYKYFIGFALDNNKIDTINIEILKYSFSSAVIMNIYDETQILSLIKKLFKIQGQCCKKIKMFIAVIQLIIWLRLFQKQYKKLFLQTYRQINFYLKIISLKQINKQQKQIQFFLQLLIQNKFNGFNMIQQRIEQKIYLYHLMTDDYRVILIQLNLLGLLLSKVYTSDEKIAQYLNHYQSQISLVMYQNAFNLSQFHLGKQHLYRYYLIKQQKQNSQILKYFVYKSTLIFFNYQYSNNYIFNNIQNVQKQESCQSNLVNELLNSIFNREFKAILQKIKIIIKELTCQNISVHPNHYLYFIRLIQAVHRYSKQNQNANEFFTKQIYQTVYVNLILNLCINCKIEVLPFLHLYQNFKDKQQTNLQNNEDMFIHNFIGKLKLKKQTYPFRLLKQYLNLIKFNQSFQNPTLRKRLKYDYIKFIFEGARMGDNFEIYFRLQLENRLIGHTLSRLFWRQSDDFQSYFCFVENLCKVIHFSRFKIHCCLFKIYVYVFTFELKQEMDNQTQIIFDKNYQYILTQLKTKQTNLLGDFLFFMLTIKPDHLKIQTKYFIYIWKHNFLPLEPIQLRKLYFTLFNNIKDDKTIRKRRLKQLINKINLYSKSDSKKSILILNVCNEKNAQMPLLMRKIMVKKILNRVSILYKESEQAEKILAYKIWDQALINICFVKRGSNII